MSDRVLFVSGRCPHSKKVLIGIQQYPFLKPLFKVVNIDTQPYPNYVKSIPAILINNQVITGQTVFEYFGKLVEGKKAQEARAKQGQQTESDQGQCRINEDGELEGWCGGGSSVEYSMISEENDDYTKRTYKMETNYDFLEGASDSIHSQVKSMEESDAQLSQKRKSFDNDLERMQRERGEMMQQQSGPGGPRPPMGQGPGLSQGPGRGSGQNMMR
tara:strand:- start:2562 stop:3209 length:648 start_codon:yes stop_codon:yes gene_type:complete